MTKRVGSGLRTHKVSRCVCVEWSGIAGWMSVVLTTALPEAFRPMRPCLSCRVESLDCGVAVIVRATRLMLSIANRARTSANASCPCGRSVLLSSPGGSTALPLVLRRARDFSVTRLRTASRLTDDAVGAAPLSPCLRRSQKHRLTAATPGCAVRAPSVSVRRRDDLRSGTVRRYPSVRCVAIRATIGAWSRWRCCDCRGDIDCDWSHASGCCR